MPFPLKRYSRRLSVGSLGLAATALTVGLIASLTFVSPSLVIYWVRLAQSSSFLTALFYLGFVLAALIVPISLFPIIGGVLFPFAAAVPLNLFAMTLGAYLSFLISRQFGRKTVQRFFGQRLKSWDQTIETKGFQTVFLVRWLGLPPYTFANYAFGLSRVRRRDYLLGTLAGVFPWTVAVTYMANSAWSAFLRSGQAGLKNVMFNLWWPMALFSVFVLVTYGSSRLIRTYIRTLPQ